MQHPDVPNSTLDVRQITWPNADARELEWLLESTGPALGLKGDISVYVGPSAVASRPQTDELRASEPVRWLQCLHCNQNVTRSSDRIEVNGKHEHSFINPVGVIYRIGCFGRAVGIIEVGEASSHFTWFAGHVWRIALCRGCERHLGWTFRGGESHFSGLVLNQLKEAR